MTDLEKTKKYAIFLQIDDAEWDYLRKRPESDHWSSSDPVVLFDTKEEALKECRNWNTGSVVEYPYWRQYEKQRAEKINANIPPNFFK